MNRDFSAFPTLASWIAALPRWLFACQLKRIIKRLRLPEMLDNEVRMSLPAGAPAYDRNPFVRESATRLAHGFGLETSAYIVVSRSVFVDYTRMQSGFVQGFVRALLAEENRPSNVIVLLPADLPFRHRQKIGCEITDAGGTVVIRDLNQTFKEAVDAKIRAYNFSSPYTPSGAGANKLLPISPDPSRYEPFKYSEIELQELIRAYSSGHETKSVLS